VVCTVKLAAGASRTIQLPLVVSLDLKGGETLTGGCVDAALSTAPKPDSACGGDTDIALPDIPVARHKVNLAIEYGKPAVTLTPGTAVVIRVPYTNDGTETADNVTFTVRPPAGVVVQSAAILLDTASAESISAAATANTVAATCKPAGGSEAANAVVCEAPDQAALAGSELWLTLDASNSTKSGTQAMRVTVSTSSADGNSTDNTVEVMLKLKAASSGNGGDDGDNGNGGGGNDGGGDLPRTGPQIFGALLTSLMLIIAGSLMLVTMRRPGAAAVAGRVPTSYPARHVRPVARPWTRRRRDDRQSG
jgi:large repetitive protein